VAKDGHNRIIFRQNAWCREPAPTDSSEPRCYDPSALAITTVFQLKNSGEILDADLEVNAVTFTWGDFVGKPDLMPYGSHDFQGAITHELGHVLGLEHTCYNAVYRADGMLVSRPVDNLGNPVPDCGYEAPASVAEATMYVSVNSPQAEVGLRTLSPDDAQGVCEIYPYSAGYVCEAPSSDRDNAKGGGGCSLTARSRSGPIAVALVLLAALALLCRRPR